MAKLSIRAGSLDVTLLVWIGDSASTTGGGKTGLVYNAAGLACYYARPGSAAAALTLATQTVTGAHADGGFVEIDGTNMPGLYRLDLSDAIVAAGARSVVVMLRGAAGMAPLVLELDLASEVDAVRIGGTAQTGRDVGASVLISAGTGAGQIAVTGGVVSATVASIAAGAVDAAALAADAAAEIADAVWDEALAGHATPGSAGKALSDAGAAGNPWEATGLEAMAEGTAGRELHLAKAALANKIAHDQAARTRTIFGDDGVAVLRVLEASSDITGAVITEEPQ